MGSEGVVGMGGCELEGSHVCRCSLSGWRPLTPSHAVPNSICSTTPTSHHTTTPTHPLSCPTPTHRLHPQVLMSKPNDLKSAMQAISNGGSEDMARLMLKALKDRAVGEAEREWLCMWW